MTIALSRAAGAQDADTAAVPVLGSESVVYESPDPAKVYAYSPGLARLDSGRLVATMDQGIRDTRNLPDLKIDADGRKWRGKIYTSDDHGATWIHRSDMPLCHARPFAAGDALYVLGHSGDLGIMRSGDGGDSWGGPFWLTQGEAWHQAPCNVLYTNGRVYLVMEKNTDRSFRGWGVSVLAPVVMAADVTADLTQRDAWTFSNELSYRQAVEQAGPPHLVGIPFYPTGQTAPDNAKDKRGNAPAGWLETNIVQFTDPDHLWCDPAGHTFHLWMRAHSGTTNMACIAKAVEAEDGSITVSLEQAPSGEPMLYVPCPGGQMKFHILYDEPSRRFWLLSTQATDSMRRPDRLPAERYNLPNNERRRLQLHFSANCIDWCFAGLVAAG
ncbi:MAG: exo-alpha-sialidase, partial [Candidatus Hydrogenedentes bacterium]|nr:exo-alpha-sialidase [Candidatus Hydrogenedentota bacterium]